MPPVVIVWALAIATTIYGIGVTRLWRAAGRGRGISRLRMLLYAAGTATIGVAILPPLDTLADETFAGHMTQHLLLICVAAPLLVLGKPIIALVWALPGSWRRMGGSVTAALNVLGRPSVAWPLSVATLAFWHVPRAYMWATGNDSVHVTEHTLFLVTSCLFWWSVLPGANGRRAGYGISVLSITAMAMLMGIYGAVLTFAHVPLYGAYRLADQQLAGVIMWIPTGVIYLGAALWCVFAWISVDEPALMAARLHSPLVADEPHA